MRYLFILLALVVVSCSNPEKQRAESKKEIKAVLMQQQDFWNEGNIEGFMKGYYKSDSLRFASGGNVSYGWQTTLERYKNGYPDKKTMGTLLFSNIDIKILSGETAVAFGKWELQREKDHPWGLFTLILKKTGCGWRIIHDHTSVARE